MAVTPTGGQFGVVGMTAANDELVGDQYVAYLYWHSKSAIAGDDLSVTNTAGTVIWECVADGANFIAIFPVRQKHAGVKVATIDSGTVYVVKASTDKEHNY